ncbi:hypothetical protein AJ80_00652 [Polytolypa hystricis UAMH7299]|uniref:Uncharacterized protein n=1 Tax=Polytolypa hystricis (strain UAMH7299) TaxID=1447883 RepID=A0A2B7Z318_POLH7|nr:hypothetical protein AJ80_00652 [Polytolypa hystricis UAMH7299]
MRSSLAVTEAKIGKSMIDPTVLDLDDTKSGSEQEWPLSRAVEGDDLASNLYPIRPNFVLEGNELMNRPAPPLLQQDEVGTSS